MNYKERCADCINLIEKNGCWCCQECFNQKCVDIDDCPEGIDENIISETKEMEKNAKKIKNYAKSENLKERKPKPRKIDNEKLEIMQAIKKAVDNLGFNSTIEKELYLHFDNYTIKLTRHREKKK